MKKRIISLILIMLMTATIVVSANFTDVPTGSEYYDAITLLSNRGIISGFEDGSFRPDETLTRAQAAAIIVRAAGYSETSANSTYSDVPNTHWASKYIMTATKQGILNGIGNSMFGPENTVTYNQFVKMVVCMLGYEEYALYRGGWPSGYLDAADAYDIIDDNTRRQILTGAGDRAIDRKNVALILHRAVLLQDSDSIYVADKKYYIGMDAKLLETADEVLRSTVGFDWYVYNTDTYKDFIAVGIEGTEVVALAAAGKGFNYLGYEYGDVKKSGEKNYNIYTDSNDGNIIHGVLILADGKTRRNGAPLTQEEIRGESKMNFHLTNAFRVAHNKKPYEWHEKAAKAAQLHSEDMANNNYFDHESLDGRTPGERLSAQGIRWRMYGENIAAGTSHYLGFHTYNGWINSSGHRSNMLGECKSLGVGIAYSANSNYSYYHTQSFVTD